MTLGLLIGLAIGITVGLGLAVLSIRMFAVQARGEFRHLDLVRSALERGNPVQIKFNSDGEDGTVVGIQASSVEDLIDYTDDLADKEEDQ